MASILKHTLDEIDRTDDVLLFGIVSSAPDFNVCWHINKLMSINLARVDDVKNEVFQKQAKKASLDLFSEMPAEQLKANKFSTHHAFKFNDEHFFTEYFLFANKGSDAMLYPEQKKASYILEIAGNKTENPEEFLYQLNAIEPISLAYLIGNESIINKLHLIV